MCVLLPPSPLSVSTARWTRSIGARGPITDPVAAPFTGLRRYVRTGIGAMESPGLMSLQPSWRGRPSKRWVKKA